MNISFRNLEIFLKWKLYLDINIRFKVNSEDGRYIYIIMDISRVSVLKKKYLNFISNIKLKIDLCQDFIILELI